MNKLLNYYFYISCSTGLLVYLMSKTTIYMPKIVRFYVNDFLIIPIVLTICLFVIRGIKGEKTYKIPIAFILYVCIMYSIFFEYYLPTFHSRYTRDYVDVTLYFIGGVVFYLLQKYSVKKTKTST
ncbi:conserved membrane protein of unknown function [Tenacibaculum sp. 190524A02b]